MTPNKYFEFLGLEESQLPEVNTQKAVLDENEEIELGEITEDQLEVVSNEIESAFDVTDNTLDVTDELQHQVDSNDVLLNGQNTEITELDVLTSQESYYLALGKLGYTKDQIQRISIESFNSNRERLSVSNEGIVDFIKTVWEKIQSFFRRIAQMIGRFFKMIKEFIFGKAREEKRDEVEKVMKTTKEDIRFDDTEIKKVTEMLGCFKIYDKPILNNPDFKNQLSSIIKDTNSVFDKTMKEMTKILVDSKDERLKAELMLLSTSTLNNAILKIEQIYSRFNGSVKYLARADQKFNEFIKQSPLTAFTVLHKDCVNVFSVKKFDSDNEEGGSLNVYRAQLSSIQDFQFREQIEKNVNVLFDNNGKINQTELIKFRKSVQSYIDLMQLSEKSIESDIKDLDKHEKVILKDLNKLTKGKEGSATIRKILKMVQKFITIYSRLSQDLYKSSGDYVLTMSRVLDYLYSKCEQKVIENKE